MVIRQIGQVCFPPAKVFIYMLCTARVFYTVLVWYIPYAYGMFFCTIRVWYVFLYHTRMVVPYAYICFAQYKTFYKAIGIGKAGKAGKALALSDFPPSFYINVLAYTFYINVLV